MSDDGYTFGLDGNGFPRQYDCRMIGQAWVDDGYPISPSYLEAEDCPVCGAPQTTCTNETHTAGMDYQRALEIAENGG